jgi:excisionase family DNA binding protein
MNPEVFDLPGAAAYLGIPTLQLKTLAKSGRITYSRIDRLRWRFTKRHLDSYIERTTHRAKNLFETALTLKRNAGDSDHSGAFL